LTEPAPPQPRSRLWPALALAWLLAVAALGAHQVGFWREARLDSDVMALLPGEGDDALLQAANHRIADAATRQVVVLLGSRDWHRSRQAAEAFLAALAAQDDLLRPIASQDDALSAAVDFYAPNRRGLLTPAQREQLRTTPPEAWVEPALARLYGPGPGGGLGQWQDDPLGLWPDWWQARAGRGLQPRDGLLALEAEGRHWALLRFESRVSAFRLDGERRIQDALDQAAAAAKAAAGGDLQRVQGGVPLHAEAAAVQASREVNTIGLGSLLAVIALVWLAFRSPRPILLVSATLLIGCAAGVSATALVFGKVHLLTLVFGASLVGVAEDYGIHWFATRQGQPGVAPRSLMRQLLPGLFLALATSVLAYLALVIAPFPGLRQMALFSAAGLSAAFLTVVLWFPWLDRAAPRPSSFAAKVGASLARWPRWRPTRAGLALAVLAAAFAVGGLLRLQVNDDLRSLQSSPRELVLQEIRVGRLLGLPSPAQFFLVTGADPERLLQAEEALTDRLQTLQAQGRIGGWRAVSDWLPSAARQRQDQALGAAAETAVLARLGELLGETPSAPSPAARPLTPADWLAQPVSEPLRPLWLGQVQGQWGSVVMLEGLGTAVLPELESLAAGVPGLRWIDRTATISAVLGHYRRMMGGLLLAGYAAVGLALWLRFRGRAWRALLPTALAALLTLAALGWAGVPLQLFGVLAQLLLLGFGVDYGIFLLEHRDDPASWLAVSLGAASTLLAFGLLALSATPALHSFGLSLGLGIALVWMLSPCFRPAPAAPPFH
jgi:predicted exporter